ncbi:MAG: hypothetical protein AAGC80_02935 [Rhodococcus sp. (in: high G+C Gram-positive bacteria)]
MFRPAAATSYIRSLDGIEHRSAAERGREMLRAEAHPGHRETDLRNFS